MKSMVMSKLTQLINDEVMKQLAENYHELLPKMVKVDVDHIEEDMSYAIGAVYFMIAERLLFIPIVYRNGGVDAVSYIGDVENEKLYGLTRKLYKRLVSASKKGFGTSLSTEDQERLVIDRGIIGHLFATPQTMSPKVASDENYHENIIIDLLNNNIFHRQFTKLAGMPEYNEVLHSIYSQRVFDKLASKVRFEKIASAREYDGSMTLTKMADLADIPQKMRADAAMAIATVGFYKVASDETMGTKTVDMVIPKIGVQLLKTKSDLQVLTKPGIYHALTKSLDMVPVFVAQVGFENRYDIFYKNDSVCVQSGSQDAKSKRSYYDNPEGKPEFIGLVAASLNGDPRIHLESVVGKAVEAKNARKVILTLTDEDISVFGIMNVTHIGDTTVIKCWNSNGGNTTIEIDPAHSYTRRGDTIYVNPNHAMFVGKYEGMGIAAKSYDTYNGPDAFGELLTSNDLDTAIVKTASFEVTHSAGAYHYAGERYSREELMQALSARGLDDEALGIVVKTAAESTGMPVEFHEMSKTLKAILAELKGSKATLLELKNIIAAGASEAPQEEGVPQDPAMAPSAAPSQAPSAAAPEDASGDVTAQIVELAGSVGVDGNKIIEAATAKGMPLEEVLAGLQEEVSAIQQQAQAQQGTGTGAPIDQDMAAQQAQAGGQAPAAPGQDPMQQQAPEAGQSPEERTSQNLQQQGFNTNMSPEMLNQLQSIADKDVLNASIISYLIDTADAKSVITQYLTEVDTGVNGLARTLLLIEIQRSSFTKQIGEKQLDSFVNRGKTLLNRLTDFVIDTSLIE